jgi:hypothetical protein
MLRLSLVAILLVIPSPSHSLIECSVSPDISNGKRWLWRDVDSRKCWFIAQPGQRRGQDQPREELRWPMQPVASPPPPPPEPDVTERAPWELEPRWLMPNPGWDHKE